MWSVEVRVCLLFSAFLFCLLTVLAAPKYEERSNQQKTVQLVKTFVPPVGCEISFGIRDSSSVPEKDRLEFPLAFWITNRGTKPIPDSDVTFLFFQGELHAVSGDKETASRFVWKWRTATWDIAPNQSFECPNYGTLTQYLPGLSDGEYEVWWTLGKLKSNSLKFSISEGKARLVK